MRNLVSAIVGRQAVGMAITGGLLLAMAALGFIALGCFAFALYHYLLPMEGAVAAACITAGVFLAAALIILLIVRHRLTPAAQPEAAPASNIGGLTGQTDLGLVVAHLLRDELPKNAVPATLVALLGGVAVGVNPEAARNVTRDLLESLIPKHG